MNPQLLQPKDPSQIGGLDPQAKNLAIAIRQTESGGNFQARGKSGEYGAYQYTAPTWAKDSVSAGVNIPLEQATPEQQNEVAYKKIKALKDAGHNVGEIASIWNSGDPQAYLNNKTGTNSSGVKYDVPAYAKSVATAYQTIKGGGQVGTDVNNPSSVSSGQQEQSLGEQLSGRLSDAGTALSEASQGKINPISGVLQTVGAGAGAVGDVVNKGLELIPGVKQVESLIGKGFGKLADTPVGQSVSKSIQDFATAHPELAGDIGAGFNIVTAIPILKGLSVVKELAGSGISQALRGIAEKGIIKDITEPLSKTGSGRDLLSNKNFTDIVRKEIIDKGNIPDIENVDGIPKYNVSEALSKNEQLRRNIAEKELQPELEKAQEIINKSHESERLSNPSVAGIETQAINSAKEKLQDTGPIKRMFDRIRLQYGDRPTLPQLNMAKKLVSEQVPQKAFDLEGYNANYNVRQSIQKAIEDSAQKLGLKDVNVINAKMRSLYQADDILNALHGKKVKIGLGSKLLRKGVSVGAGILANQLGAGELGGLGVGLLADTADKGIQGIGAKIKNGILKRTTGQITKPSLLKVAKQTGGLI